MPTSVTCMWNGSEIEVEEALRIREENDSPLFLCVSCGERVRVHHSGGHTDAHFEHINRNPDCPLSHSDSYQYGGAGQIQNPDSVDAIEGYATERKYLSHNRNAALVLKCKERDNYTCQACGLALRVNGRSIIECHHLMPLANNGERITSLDELICLCPTCHRVAHTSKPPLKLDQISVLIANSILRSSRSQ